MKPHRCCLVLHVSVLSTLLLTLNADGEDLKCETEIKVRRNTVYDAVVGQELRIYCPVTFCNTSPPTVTWYKVGKAGVTVPVNVSDKRIKTVWTPLSPVEKTSSLIFTNIVSNDSGQYQCHSGGSVSHSINVSVYAEGEQIPAGWSNTTSVPTSVPEPTDVWMYVYCSAGIVVFVVMVTIISVISMRGCKGTTKQETHADNQYMEIPMVERPSSQASPRGSPLAPLPRRSTRRKPQEDQPGELTPPGHDQPVYGQIREDRQRQRPVEEEEGGSVVYAALNHQLPPGAAARPPRLQVTDEASEYAAIRVS